MGDESLQFSKSREKIVKNGAHHRTEAVRVGGKLVGGKVHNSVAGQAQLAPVRVAHGPHHQHDHRAEPAGERGLRLQLLLPVDAVDYLADGAVLKVE